MLSLARIESHCIAEFGLVVPGLLAIIAFSIILNNMIEQVLLASLLDGPLHGYGLYQALQRRVGLVCAVNSVTQLYPFLRKMRDRGWVAERVEVQAGRPNRHVYAITDRGREEFAAWLTRPVTRRREIRDEFLVKLFFSASLDPAQSFVLFDQHIASYTAYKAELEAARDQAEAAGLLPLVLAAESGIRHSQADVEWAAWCKAEIARRTGIGA